LASQCFDARYLGYDNSNEQDGIYCGPTYKRPLNYKILIYQDAPSRYFIPPPKAKISLQSENSGHTHGDNTVAGKLAGSSVLGLLSGLGASGGTRAAHGAASANLAGGCRTGGGSGAGGCYCGRNVGEGYTGGAAEGRDGGCKAGNLSRLASLGRASEERVLNGGTTAGALALGVCDATVGTRESGDEAGNSALRDTAQILSTNEGKRSRNGKNGGLETHLDYVV